MSFVCKLLGFLDSIKTYHWQTKSHARHIASDELHKKMSKLVDDFVETYYGHAGTERPSFGDDDYITLVNCDDKQALVNLKDFLSYLTGDFGKIVGNDVGLQNLRDEMVCTVRHYMYHFSFQ